MRESERSETKLAASCVKMGAYSNSLTDDTDNPGITNDGIEWDCLF